MKELPHRAVISHETMKMTPLNATDTENTGIPVLDFFSFRHGSTEESQQVATALFEAFRDVGFVYLRNHGLPQEIVDEAFSWASALPVQISKHSD